MMLHWVAKKNLSSLLFNGGTSKQQTQRLHGLTVAMLSRTSQ
jgi:hypothetical protein